MVNAVVLFEYNKSPKKGHAIITLDKKTTYCPQLNHTGVSKDQSDYVNINTLFIITLYLIKTTLDS